MRITILTQWFDPEPGAIRGLPLGSWLATQGHSVQVVTAFPNYPGGQIYPGYRMRLYQREEMSGVHVLRLPLYPSHDRSAARRTLNYTSFALTAATLGTLLTDRCDVVYAYHPPPTVGLPALLWRYIRSVPFVYHIADMWPESVTESGMLSSKRSRAVANTMLSAWCSRLYRRAAAITVLSPGFKRLLVARGVPSDKVTIIWNWADEQIFRPILPDPVLADRLGIQGGFRVIYAGNLGPFQALQCAIRAAHRVRHLPGFELLLVGGGQDLVALRALADELGATNVRFLGVHDYRNMGAISALADVLLVSLKDLPFLSATVPSKTQAALACGRPILMAATGDAARLIESAEAGIAVAPENDDALVLAFDRLYHTPREELDAMGARGRAFYTRELSLETGARRTEQILRTAAGGD